MNLIDILTQGDSLDGALCGSDGPDDLKWFPGAYETDEDAKATCRTCPVKAECLEGALEREEPHGIFGGATPEERKRIARNRARKSRAKETTE